MERGFDNVSMLVHRSMEIIATRNASLAADLREALKQHTLKDSPSSKDTPPSEAAATPGAEEDADEEDDDADVDMEDETDEEKGTLGIVCSCGLSSQEGRSSNPGSLLCVARHSALEVSTILMKCTMRAKSPQKAYPRARAAATTLNAE